MQKDKYKDIFVIAPVKEAGIRVEGRLPDSDTLSDLREDLACIRKCLHDQCRRTSDDILSVCGLPDSLETYASRDVLCARGWEEKTCGKALEIGRRCGMIALTDECGLVESPLVRMIVEQALADGLKVKWVKDILPDGGRTARAMGRSGRQALRERKARETVHERGGRMK